MEEIWRDIVGYEGLYQVSNYGRVRSLNYRRTGKEKLLKAGNNGTEHLFVNLYKNGVKKPYKVNVLVAEAFIPNPDNKPIVHHIDHNPLNNNVENLVWLTYKEHAAEHHERVEASRKTCSKHINQFTLDGLFIRVWYSSWDIQRELGYNNSHIIQCCKGKRKSANGYIWKYA